MPYIRNYVGLLSFFMTFTNLIPHDFIFHRKKKRLKYKRYNWIVHVLHGVDHIFLHDQIAYKDCAVWGQRQNHTVFAVSSVLQWAATKSHSSIFFESDRSVLLFFVLMPWEQVENLVALFSCVHMSITWTCFQFGYVFARSGDTLTWQGGTCLSLFFKKSCLLFIFAKNTLKQSGCDKFQRGWTSWSTSCCCAKLRGKKPIKMYLLHQIWCWCLVITIWRGTPGCGMIVVSNYRSCWMLSLSLGECVHHMWCTVLSTTLVSLRSSQDIQKSVGN